MTDTDRQLPDTITLTEHPDVDKVHWVVGHPDVHDTLMRDEVVNELLGSLTVVRLDARSEAPVTTPSGKKTTPKDWSKSLGLFARPAIAIYDGERELLRIAGVLRRFHFQNLRQAASRANLGIHGCPSAQLYLAPISN